MRKRAKSKQVVPTTLAFGVIAACAIVAFAQGGKRASAKSTVTRASQASTAEVALAADTTTRKPLSYYTSGVRADLFTPPAAPAPAAPKVKLTKPAPAPKPTLPPPAPAIVDPFADYAYDGTVTMGNQTLALVENTKTKEGQYLRVGDSFIGGQISGINEHDLTIDVAGTTKVIAKTDNFKMTSLDKSAPVLTQQPQQGAQAPPGAPAMNGAPTNMPAGANNPQDRRARWQQRLQNMSPEQRQMIMDRMMNRSMNGGGRRWGGEGG